MPACTVSCALSFNPAAWMHQYLQPSPQCCCVAFARSPSLKSAGRNLPCLPLSNARTMCAMTASLLMPMCEPRSKRAAVPASETSVNQGLIASKPAGAQARPAPAGGVTAMCSPAAQREYMAASDAGRMGWQNATWAPRASPAGVGCGGWSLSNAAAPVAAHRGWRTSTLPQCGHAAGGASVVTSRDR